MKVSIISLLAITAIGLRAADAPAELKTQEDKVSYSIGLDIGRNLKRQSIEVNPDLLAAGLKDALGGGKTLLTEEESRQVMTQFQQDLRNKAQERTKEMGEKAKKEGEAFLAENKGKPGVKTTPSGLQYKIITEGAGRKPSSNDTVVVHYRGTLIDGTEFDSSYKRGEPATFPVTGVIKGWTEALQMMPVGSKWQLFIPSDLAYGERGAGRNIPPNSTLLFDVELLDIKDANAAAKPAVPEVQKKQ